MSIHQVGCKLGGRHYGVDCRDDDMVTLGPVLKHEPGCTLGDHNAGLACFPRIEATSMEVSIPVGPQPLQPGPLHAVVRGPGGLDVSISADHNLFGRLLSAVGEAITYAVGDE